MITCKVKPDADRCHCCLDMIEMYPDAEISCGSCGTSGVILSYGTGFWSGDYAMVLIDGKIQKVSLGRIYDVEVKDDKTF